MPMFESLRTRTLASWKTIELRPWEVEIDRDLRKPVNGGHVCVTELVEYMICTCKEGFKGTVHEDDWMFYHDALKQMTDKRCIQWMQEKDYLRRWILPTHGCNNEFARFRGRPIGDTPEVMPWDCHLNADVDACVRRHITKTKGCPDNRRFHRSTVTDQTLAFLRVLDPDTGVCPSSERIITDFGKCFGKNLLEIYAVKGIIVPGCGNRYRNGHRAAASVNREVECRGAQPGERRELKPRGEEAILHSDAKSWVDEVRAKRQRTH
jgi:hypothetical protein